MTNLKENRKNNHLDFDDQEPENGHLLRFEKKLEKAFEKPKSLVWKLSRIAAVIFMAIGLSSVFYFMNDSEQQTDTLVAEQKADFPLEDAENFYRNEFDKQFAVISNTFTDEESKQMIEESEEMIIDLQKEYKNLELELKNTGDYRVATAMILNYKSRINILENLIEKLKYVTQLKEQKNEPQTS